MKSHIPVPRDFDFWRTVYSHGWCSLPPFSVEQDRRTLRQIMRLSSGKTITIDLTPGPGDGISLNIPASSTITPREKKEIATIISSCFRIDEDLSPFYAEAKRHPRFRWAAKAGAGRLLRAQTVFEDVVKMICTTNCSWSLTQTMVRNLCSKLGARVDGTSGPERSFPVPAGIAASSEKFLRKEIRAGYRAPYLLEFARRVENKDIDVESWRQSTLPTVELFEEVRSVKGVGPYAAGNILKLLGRYDYLAVDSWCRKKFFELHKNGRRTSDKVIERFYEPFGKWRGLYFWLDVTKDWYDHKFPF